MKASNEPSDKSTKPATGNQNQRTIDEWLEEIWSIINTNHFVQTRLSKLEANGFEVQKCFVKNGSIEKMIFMKRKKVLRIQVTESEPRGKYHTANCVIIPAANIKFQEGDSKRVRHLPILQGSDSEMSNPEKRIVKYKHQNYGTK